MTEQLENHMEHHKIGWLCSIILGFLSFTGTLTYFFLPVKPGTDDGGLFFVAISSNQFLYEMYYLQWGLTGVFGLAAIPSITKFIAGEHDEALNWIRNLALVGFALLFVSAFRLVALLPVQAMAYMDGNSTVQKALLASPLSLDPHLWIIFGTAGIWVLTMSMTALRKKIIPIPLGAVGIIMAIAYWMVVMGFIMENTMPVKIAAAMGSVLGPVFYIWMGFLAHHPQRFYSFRPVHSH